MTSEPNSSTPRFPALRHRNFRLFWVGNAFSLVGTLAQDAARGWLVRSLTADPFTISAVAACGSLPVLFLTLYTGAVADRVDKRRSLLFTNLCALGLAAILAILTYFEIIQVWQVAVLALALGMVHAFDVPIRQSFNIEMVGRDDLPNAIALNSMAFNVARVGGPAVGGIFIQTLGLTGCFAFNALSFLALIFGLSKMDLAPQKVEKVAPGLKDIREGFDWMRNHPVLWPLTLLLAVNSLFAGSHSVLLAVFAKDVFHTGAGGFSALLTAGGAGALASTASLAWFGMRHKGKRILLGALGFSACVAGFGAAPGLGWGCFWLGLAGWSLLTFLTTANTLVQTGAPDELRGRVFSFYSLALIGVGPIGALWTGAVAKATNPRAAVEIGATVAGSFAVWTFWRHRAVWKEK